MNVLLNRYGICYDDHMISATLRPSTQTYALQDTESFMGEGVTNSRYILRVKDLPDAEKPREKLLTNNPADLSTTELVAVLLQVGTKKEEVMTMANRIVREYGERAIITETSASRLAEILDIPLPKACQLVASMELGRRFYEKRHGKAVYVATAQQAFDYLQDMSHLSKEQLRGLYLNSRYQVIHEEVISTGSLTSNIVHPREVFQPAIERGAVAVIVAHNHPSGSLEETSADVEVTDRLKIAGDILGIELLDHLVIAAGSYKSIINRA
jgi:DNA repair protein RadC